MTFEIIERYIYAVTSRLPQSKREDIRQELRSIIEDMMEAYGGHTEENARRAIEELGDPKKLAEKYNDSPKYLISPAVYDNYVLILKIVLFAVTIGVIVGAIADSFAQPGVWQTVPQITAGAAGAIGNFFADLIGGLVTAFAWVTIVFFILDRYNVRMDLKMDKEWSIENLRELPKEGGEIKRGECIAGIVFSTVFMLIFALVPWVLSAYFPVDGSIQIVPVFDLQVVMQRMGLFFAMYGLGILKEAGKLIAGRWSTKLGIFSAVISVITLLLMLGIFADMAIWNPSFAGEVTQLGNIGSDIFISVWNIITSVFVFIVVIASVLGMVTEIIKGVRHN
ncbi:MAG: HAAS signaling domain-containing protein [Christensenellaceae bacterium]|jgi:hypothetical protein